MSTLSTCAFVALLVGGPMQDEPGRSVAIDALERAHYHSAELLIDALPAAGRGTLAPRLWFEVGDYVRCTQSSKAALASASNDEERREIAWWGAKAALWLGDAEAARAWVDVMRATSGGAKEWVAVTDEYDVYTRELASQASESRQRLLVSRLVVLLGSLVCAATGWLALRALARDSRA